MVAVSLNRILFAMVAWAGFGSIAFAVIEPWFSVPLAPPQGVLCAADMIDQQPHFTVWFQAVVAVGGIAMAVLWMRKFRWTTVGTVIACLLVWVPLTYPYFVVSRSPEISADAAWLQSQHDNLTWLGGDIFANAEYANKGWKSKTYLIDTPRQLAVIKLPSWSPWEFGLHRCEDLLLWLGYSNTYCQFVKRGWVMAILGGALLLLVSLQDNGTLMYHRAGLALAIFTTAAGLAAVAGWSLPFQASQNIRAAAKLCSQGKYDLAQQRLEAAVDALPVLAQDTNYLSQRGVLDQRQGIDSEYATLRSARALETSGRYEQAYTILRRLVRSESAAIRREALRGVMRHGIQDYNCARFELSAHRFRTVLRHQPCNVKIIYLLQLQGIRESRLSSVNAMRDWMYTASSKLNFGTVKILRAVSQQHAAVAAGLEGNPDQIWSALGKAKRP